MFASHLKSNFKGPLDVDLGPCTLIVGHNKSGKTSVIDALSLALCGEGHSPGLGRQEVRLMAAKPAEDETLFSEATLSGNGDGAVKVGWAATGTTAKAKKATWGASDTGLGLPAGVLIADEAAALITADPKKLRPALLGQLNVVIAQEVIRAQTPPSLWPRLETLLGATNGAEGDAPSYGTDALMRALSGTGDQLRGARKALRQAKAELDGGVASLTDAEEAELRELIGLASAAVMTEAEVDELKALAARLETEMARTREEIGRMGAPTDVDSRQYQVAEAVRKAQSAIMVYVEAQGRDRMKACPCCGTEDVPLTTLRERADAYAALLSGFDSARQTDIRREELERVLEQRNEERAQALRQVEAATVGQGADRERLRELQEAKARAERAAALGDEKLRLETTVNELKTLQGLCQDIVSANLDAEVERLVARINLGMPSDMEVGIELRDGPREVCRVAVNGRDVRALCGAERAALVAAFTSAVVTDGHPPVRLLVVDDVWLDPTMIPSVLDGVRTIVEADAIGPTQAIVSLVQYDGPDPDGWQVVRL